MTKTTSIAQSSVAAKIISSPVPIAIVPASPAIAAWPATSSPIAAKCGHASRSRSSGTASRATQITSVLWMNAACVEEARASPSKKRTKATLPPMTPSARSAAHWSPERGLGATRPACLDEVSSGKATSTSRIPATPFFAVVYTVASSKRLTA